MADISAKKLRKRIKAILEDADSNTLSAKKVRLKLQEMLDVDLSSRKKEIDKMTMSVFMELEEQKKDKEESDDGNKNDKDEEEEEEEEQNGGNQSDDQVEEKEDEEPPKKKSKSTVSTSKKKKSKKGVDEDADLEPLENDDLNVYDEEQKTLKLSDEELAKRLQSFEETGRRTRNRGTPKKKERKKSSGGGNNAYSKPCVLSSALAELMGTDQLARNEVVKKMWEIVRERKLLDPKDRRFMLCDEQLQKIFGRKRVQMFVMMKYLTSHIREGGSTIESVITNSDIYDDEADDD
ncbi:hypothetical protein ACF0H5_009724 [Mactra antiquata]